MSGNATKFLEDIKIVRKYFPDLYHSPSENNDSILEGHVPIYDANHFLRDIFQIRIVYSSSYPKGFAKLYEIGNEIPKSLDWHKYGDSQCCVCSEPEELIQQQISNNAQFFLREYTIPFLVNYLHKKEYKFYPNGEYEHGNKGIIQWYQEKFPSCSLSKIRTIINTLYSNKPLPKLHQACLCGSKVKFKKCHYRICRELLLIPKKNLLFHISLIADSPVSNFSHIR